MFYLQYFSYTVYKSVFSLPLVLVVVIYYLKSAATPMFWLIGLIGLYFSFSPDLGLVRNYFKCFSKKTYIVFHIF